MESELEAMMVGGWVKGDRAKLFLRVSLKCNWQHIPSYHAENFKRPNSAVRCHHLWPLALRAEGSKDCQGPCLDWTGPATGSVFV